MAQVTLNISNNSLHFFVELIKHFDFIQKIEVIKNTDNKTEIFNGIKQAVSKMNLIKEGKLKTQPINVLLDEL